MKINDRFTKAGVVIIIVGIGFFSNLNKKMKFTEFIYSETIQSESIKVDSLKPEPNRLFIYTKNIINEGIHHLISNL